MNNGFFRKLIDSNLFLGFIIFAFIIGMVFTVCIREGKDLKVGLFGVVKTLQKESPYENPTDPNRTIYRYAPGTAILQYPFLLKSEMVAPFQFKNIIPSVISWFLFEILSLIISAWMLLKLIPSISREVSMRNLKISFLMALPLIGYELSNCQNKLVALCFMLIALFLFEKNKLFLSAAFFNLALTVYIALLPFVLYFLLEKKAKYLVNFILGALLVFIILPSMAWGFSFNNYLLKEWFNHALKPFFFTNSYVTYIDLRHSNQALPGVIGRLFVLGETGSFKYLIPPFFIHAIIRVISAGIVISSCAAVWKPLKAGSKGLAYAIFLILALILPLYVIYYTWAWMFVIYFAVLNYASYPQTPKQSKKILLGLAFLSYAAILLMGFDKLNYFSLIFWATLLLWLGIVATLIRQPRLNSS